MFYSRVTNLFLCYTVFGLLCLCAWILAPFLLLHPGVIGIIRIIRIIGVIRVIRIIGYYGYYG
jgi:hypothetical protein